jgi:hypothetical protein
MENNQGTNGERSPNQSSLPEQEMPADKVLDNSGLSYNNSGETPDNLKTLKDLKEFVFTKEMWECAKEPFTNKFASKEELKQEAIKIERLANDHYKFNAEMPFMARNDSERKFLQSFLKWFFNLEEITNG